jgi:acyl-CoA synthetase (AMP-forming)/AMP-acid ligase II
LVLANRESSSVRAGQTTNLDRNRHPRVGIPRSEPGREARADEVDELVHRGPTVALGYWRDTEATAAKFRPDPLDHGRQRPVVYSGDLVRRDNDGYLYFVRHSDQMLTCHGYRVHPGEVEEILHAEGSVSEAVVKGEPDPIAGTVLVAHCLAKQPRTFDINVVRQFCELEMPSHMIPARFHVVDLFPRTSSGKLDRQKVGTGGSGS